MLPRPASVMSQVPSIEPVFEMPPPPVTSPAPPELQDVERSAHVIEVHATKRSKLMRVL